MDNKNSQVEESSFKRRSNPQENIVCNAQKYISQSKLNFSHKFRYLDLTDERSELLP